MDGVINSSSSSVSGLTEHGTVEVTTDGYTQKLELGKQHHYRVGEYIVIGSSYSLLRRDGLRFIHFRDHMKAMAEPGTISPEVEVLYRRKDNSPIAFQRIEYRLRSVGGLKLNSSHKTLIWSVKGQK
jgi:hypothetical protein